MSKRRLLVEGLVAAATVGMMAHLLIVFSPYASAQDEAQGPLAEPSTVEPEGFVGAPPDAVPIPARDSFQRDFSKLYPPGEGDEATRYEELTKSEQGFLDRAGEWAETSSGHAVHNKWSGVSRYRRAEAKARRAEHLSGTHGLGELGVK